MKLDPFYPIFESAEWIARMLPFGMKLVQLRMKDRPLTEVRGHIARARDLCRSHGAVLVVNDYWQEAIDFGCDWIHLGQEDLVGADLSAIRRAGIKIGVSTHDHDELERALALKPDYVAFGPIYPTILKKMKWEQQGLERLREWRRLVGDLPLVAIGGMTMARATEAFAAGADIVSAVTDITLNQNPEQQLQQWIASTRKEKVNP